MTRTEVSARIAELRAVAVLRLPSSEHVPRVAEAMLEGGVHAIEVTLTTPGALTAIEQLERRFACDAVIGVGSVRTPEDVTRAKDHGAQFVVSPITSAPVIATARDHDLAVMPGALTPTEVDRAQELGADFVKVFPASFWGPKYIRALLAPMPDLRLCPTGGVTPTNAGTWIEAGAQAVGIGSALAPKSSIAAGDYGEVTRRAKTLVKSIQSALE